MEELKQIEPGNIFKELFLKQLNDEDSETKETMWYIYQEYVKKVKTLEK